MITAFVLATMLSSPSPDAIPFDVTWGEPVELFTANDIGIKGRDNNPGVIMVDDRRFDFFFTKCRDADRNDMQELTIVRGPSTDPDETIVKQVDTTAEWIDMNGHAGGPWIVGTWKHDATGDLYARLHLELRAEDTRHTWRSRIGMAKSTDGGLTWDYLGDIITQKNEARAGDGRSGTPPQQHPGRRARAQGRPLLLLVPRLHRQTLSLRHPRPV